MTPPLSHNVLPDLTSRPSADNPSAAFSQLRFSLIKVLRNSPESREPICDALELIEALQQQVERKRDPDAAPAPPPHAGRKPGDASSASPASLQEHFIQTTHEGEFLTERRPSGSQPFRCPRNAYDAAARVLEQADQPLHFDDLLDRLNAAMGQRQADYRLRVCLRFWMARNVVERFRTRYRVTPDGSPFSARAQSLWEAAKHS